MTTTPSIVTQVPKLGGLKAEELDFYNTLVCLGGNIEAISHAVILRVFPGLLCDVQVTIMIILSLVIRQCCHVAPTWTRTSQ
jgi:hypothetical protein